MKKITGKVIWITGASSGIGEALAYQLSKMGNTLILSSRNEAALSRVRSGCDTNSDIHILSLDLTKIDLMKEVTNRAIGLAGRIDILINNAGVSQRSLILETDMVVFRRLIEANYLGTVALTKALLPHFVSRKEGHFVTVTSLMGRFGSPLRSGYCGAKHALHGFFDVLRMEHGKDGIRVTLICPGFVQTQVAVNALTADGQPQGTDDEATAKGLPADVFARRMITAIRKNRFEAYIGGKEVSGIYLKRFFPRLLHRVVMRSKVV